MRVLVETSAVNWLADQPERERFFDLWRASRFEAIVTPEVATEIRATRSSERRALLESVLSRFFPLAPTRLPRMGPNLRLGLAYVGTNRNEAANRALAFLRDGPDRIHLANAFAWSCDVFLTTDQELWRQKVKEVESVLGTLRVMHPSRFLEEVELEGRQHGES